MTDMEDAHEDPKDGISRTATTIVRRHLFSIVRIIRIFLSDNKNLGYFGQIGFSRTGGSQHIIHSAAYTLVAEVGGIPLHHSAFGRPEFLDKTAHRIHIFTTAPSVSPSTVIQPR